MTNRSEPSVAAASSHRGVRVAGLLARIWPLLVVFAAAAGVYALGLQRYASFDALAERQQQLHGFVAGHPVLAPLAYIAIYTAAVAVAFPGGLVLSATGGFLFGTVAGGFYALLGITAGAVLLFLAARSALRPIVARRAGRLLDRITPGLERNGFSYLLALRLVPFMPFWLINLAPALVGMRLLPYAAATFLGIAPVTFVLASVGAGIGATLAAGGQPGPAALLRPDVLLPLLGLAVLALVPVAWRHWRERMERRA